MEDLRVQDANSLPIMINQFDALCSQVDNLLQVRGQESPPYPQAMVSKVMGPNPSLGAACK